MEKRGPFVVSQSHYVDDFTSYKVEQANGKPFAFIAITADDAQDKRNAEFLARALNDAENKRDSSGAPNSP
ncbi:hypothetical protein [Labrenzia sp. THAF35]|uniref:hypothetical protein n=1 Tax=Labrenzia sp. THAF35 TaxID=2587854 RepID=UPI001267BE51|nr:hypothetical protein [Labrenzia sp. THAF35]